MIENSIGYVLLIIIVLTSALGFINIAFGPVVFDIRRIIRSKHRLPIKPGKVRERKKISVIVPTENNFSDIEKFLKQFISGNYKKFEIIFIDNQSSDATKQQIKLFIDKYPKQNIRLVKKQRNSSWHKSIQYVSKKYISGELVLTLTPKSILSNDLLLSISNEFSNNQDLDCIKLRKNTASNAKFLSIYQLYSNLVNQHPKISNLSYANFSTGLYLGKVYKKQSFIQQYSTDSRKHTSKVVSDIINNQEGLKRLSFTEPALCLKDFLHVRLSSKFKLYKDLRAVKFNTIAGCKEFSLILINTLFSGQPIIYIYFAILGIILGSPVLYLVGWIATIISLSFVIWNAYELILIDKVVLILLLPISYLLYIAYAALEVILMLYALSIVLISPKIDHNLSNNILTS